jgi:HlyD family secretion protein
MLATAAGLTWYFTRPEPVAVKLYTVARGPVASTVANTRVGTIKACRRAYLAPALGGQVASLTVKEGSRVTKKQVLMVVWNDDLKAQVELQVAEAKTSTARASQACLIAEGAEREASRLLKLQRHKNIVSEETVDRAVTDAQAKRAACKAAHAAIDANKARIAAARAELERSIVRAPFSGVVAEVNAELGEFVTPSPPGIPTLPAIDLLDVSCLYVSAPIDEVDAPAIHTGMKASVTLDAFPNQHRSGRVSRVAPYVLDREKQARTVEVEVKLADPNDLRGLLPGYSADLEILLESRDNVLRIPTEAILDGNRVLVYHPDAPLSERRIDPGLSNWNYTEVLSGLEKGEEIVVSIGKEGVEAGAYAIAEPDE